MSDVSAARDDRILPATRAVAGLVVPFLIAAFGILYLWPGRTAALFAWTIHPNMTPMLMGAGYVAGAYFFVRVVAGRRWHVVGLGLLPTSAFAAIQGIATIVHWDRFNHHHVSFYAWVLLYATTPLLVPYLFIRNRRTDPKVLEPGDVRVPGPARASLAVAGAVFLVMAIVMLVASSVAIREWPWTLTPLTARVTAGFVSLTGVAWGVAAFEFRWSALRIPIEAVMLGMILILAAVPRGWHDFDTSRLSTPLWLGGLIVAVLAQAWLYTVMESSRRRAPREVLVTAEAR